MNDAQSHESSAISFAHMSDPHLPLRGEDVPLARLTVKQHLGRQSWLRKRHKRHRPEVLADLVADIHALAPDHMLVGGDLVNLALPGEIAAAQNWLSELGSPENVTLVPGNHDAYAAPTHFARPWAPWMESDDGAPGFPFVRRRGGVSIIGLSSGVPTPPLRATGRLGVEQIARAAEILATEGMAGQFRLILIHHPPQNRATSPRKALTDRAALQSVIARTGAELVVHGHLHHAAMATLAGPDGSVPVIGVPSASMALDTDKGDPARWHHFRIAHSGAGWDVTLTQRGLTEDGFQTLGTLTWHSAS